MSLLDNPRVVAYLQHTSLSPLELNNQRRWELYARHLHEHALHGHAWSSAIPASSEVQQPSICMRSAPFISWSVHAGRVQVGLLLLSARVCCARRIGHSVHYTVLDRSLNGHEDPHSLVGTDPAPTPWFTPEMLAKVHTLIPLIWRCARRVGATARCCPAW